MIRDAFSLLIGRLGLRAYGEPIIFSPGGEGRPENQGYDAFLPLIDSGVSLYVWTEQRFVSAIVYTCKRFDEGAAVDALRERFELAEFEAKGF